jgi:hypothetical protein
LKISLNVGLTVEQLRQVARELEARGDLQAAERVGAGLGKLGG